ncbi:MAG: alpha/beta fold hydrolase [Parachlamydiaceae bacterium]|nr:alpha/beta fold hydrolase [Parachlamydiaceae bacterium]
MSEFENREAITLENNGEKIFGILHLPKNQPSPYPVVLICSGFAGTKTGKLRLFVTLSHELAKQGIAVLRFDYRGSGDSEGEFKDITLEGKVSDTLTCLEFLRNDSRFDSQRIGLLGRSLGGVIALLSGRRFRAIKSFALWSPVFKSDPWKELWSAYQSNQMDDNKREKMRNIPGNIPNVFFLKQFFDLNLEQELQELKDIPLLHIHGEKDEIVTIAHASHFKDARHGTAQTRFVTLPNSGHDIIDPQEQEIAIHETVQWFQQTL